MLNAILAMDLNGCIGKDGTLPWRMRDDLQHFKALTEGSTVVMGRLTKESLPGSLPGRREWVLSSVNGDWDKQCDVVRGFAEMCDVWVIGGARTLESFLDDIDVFYITVISTIVEGGDTFFHFNADGYHKEVYTHMVKGERNEFDAIVYKYSRK